MAKKEVEIETQEKPDKKKPVALRKFARFAKK